MQERLSPVSGGISVVVVVVVDMGVLNPSENLISMFVLLFLEDELFDFVSWLKCTVVEIGEAELLDSEVVANYLKVEELEIETTCSNVLVQIVHYISLLFIKL